MSTLEALRERLPEVARDIKVNLQTTLGDGVLSPAQRWGIAVACGIASREGTLSTVLQSEARVALGDQAEAVLDDANAAAIMMAMNNVYYRFRHMIGKPSYSEKGARLRMQRLGKVRTTKVDFELMCLAVSAINGCEMCVRAHEKVVVDGGLTEDHVHDAVRLAATIQATAVALESVSR